MSSAMPRLREPALADLLEIEDDPSILGFCCQRTGIPLWTQIRVHFLRMLMSDLLYDTAITGGSVAVPSRRRAATFMARAMLHNAARQLAGNLRADVCLMTDAVANQWREGKWFNRLSDYFAACCPQRTLTIENHFEWRWQFPRHNDRVLFNAPRQALNTVVGRLRVTAAHRRGAAALVALVSRRAQERCGWSAGAQREAWLVDTAARKAASLPWQYSNIQRLIERIQPRALIANVACYGAAAAAPMAAANDAGVVTAEYQHGAVSGGHDAYNFAPALRDSGDYRRTLPRNFLAYGSWWNEQINAPVAKIAVGNPHRAEMLARAAPHPASREDILLLSDGVEFPKYLQLARQLAPSASRLGLRVVLRPHPLERTLVAERHGARVDDVFIDSNVDLYATLRSAHVVISELSTGLFEAVGLADKFFMWNTAKARFGYPNHPFQSFDTPDRLLELLAADDSGRLSTVVEAIWAPAWRDNFTSFLQST